MAVSLSDFVQLAQGDSVVIAISQTFTTKAISIILTCVASVYLFDLRPSATFTAGTSLVLLSLQLDRRLGRTNTKDYASLLQDGTQAAALTPNPKDVL